MRIIISAAVLSLAAGLSGCAGNAPTAPLFDDETVDDTAGKNGSTHSWQIVEWDGTGYQFYLECLGQTVTQYGILDSEVRTSVMPSGRVHVLIKVLYSKSYGFIDASGVRWAFDSGEQVAHEFTTPRGAYSVNFTAHEFYRNEVTGERPHQVFTYVLMLDDTGGAKLDMFHGWCPGAPDADFSYL